MSVYFPTKITEYFYPAQEEYVPKKRARESKEDAETVDDGRVKTKLTLPVGNLENILAVEPNVEPTPPLAPRKPKHTYSNDNLKKLGKLKV
jgi:hypothetical protein